MAEYQKKFGLIRQSGIRNPQSAILKPKNLRLQIPKLLGFLAWKGVIDQYEVQCNTLYYFFIFTTLRGAPSVSKIRPVIIGVAGGTGSGKTTVSNVIHERVGFDRITYLQHDSYYKDLTHLTLKERESINFDHPDSLETSLLVEHLHLLLNGKSINVPTYNFATHTRQATTITVYPRPVILVEGILIFAEPNLRTMFDVKIFVDTEDDIRFIRRLQRDIKERNRTTDSVIKQWLTTVKPMHHEFVEPSKRWADVIIPRGGKNQVAMDMVVTRIEALLNK